MSTKNGYHEINSCPCSSCCNIRRARAEEKAREETAGALLERAAGLPEQPDLLKLKQELDEQNPDSQVEENHIGLFEEFGGHTFKLSEPPPENFHFVDRPSLTLETLYQAFKVRMENERREMIGVAMSSITDAEAAEMMLGSAIQTAHEIFGIESDEPLEGFFDEHRWELLIDLFSKYVRAITTGETM